MPPDLLHPGDQLAGFRIDRQLGRGATGVVYLARQVALDRPVALKVVGAPFAVDAAFRARFRTEARAAAALDHPNVVTVLDSGADDERLWLAMRLVDGPDLRVLLRRTGRLEPAHAVSVVEQVAAALDAAHAAGLVHRDVKPGNVLVEDAPGGALHVELADFGLVVGAGVGDPDAVDGADDDRSRGDADADRAVEGTPEYAAPEQLEGEPATAAADVYALGRVFAEMLTGDPATPVGAGATGFAAVVARATDPDPAWRYPTAGALAKAARAVLEPGSPPARPVAGGPQRPSVAAAGVSKADAAVAGVAGRLPSPDEVRAEDDAEYEDVAPLTAPNAPAGSRPGRSSRDRRRATTLVAAPRGRRRRWGRAVAALFLLAVVAAAALLFGELRDGRLESDPASDRSRIAAPPTGAGTGTGARPSSRSPSGSRATTARGTRSGAAPGTGSGTASGPRAATGPGSGSPATSGSTGTADAHATSGSTARRAADRTGGTPASGAPSAGASPAGAAPRSSAPPLGGAGPGTAPSASAFPPAPDRTRFGGGSWSLDLPAAAGWRQTAVQELSGGRRLLTRLRRSDGTRIVVEHRPGQTAVFGPWPGQAFAVRSPRTGRTDALLFRGGRYAMCREAVCAAVAVNGPSGGVLLIVASTTDARTRGELRRVLHGLRVG